LHLEKNGFETSNYWHAFPRTSVSLQKYPGKCKCFPPHVKIIVSGPSNTLFMCLSLNMFVTTQITNQLRFC